MSASGRVACFWRSGPLQFPKIEPPYSDQFRFPTTRKETLAMPVATSEQDRAARLRAQQVQQAEELLFSGPSRAGVAKALFRGEVKGDGLFPYPELTESERA